MTATTTRTGVVAGRTAGARLLVDWTRCDGRGLCAELLPDLVGRDDWGFPVIGDRAVRTDELSYAKRAVGDCPVLALRLQAR